MAKITEPTVVPTSIEVAFDHLADFTTTADWDPGIVAAERLDDGPIGLGSRFRVRSKTGLITVPLEYEITAYERPNRLVLETSGPLHRGEDDVRFETTSEGTKVTWNAEFAIRGPGKLIDPLLGIGFRNVGKAAIRGLDRSLRQLADDAS
jgi:dehydrogenase/reductase SDR family member 12